MRSSISTVTYLIAATVFVTQMNNVASAAMKDDLGVMFRSDSSLPDPGGIAGTVTNKSTRNYHCVELVFKLYYNSATTGPAEKRIRITNLNSKAVRNYSAPLISKAGFGLQRIESCSVTAEIPPDQAQKRDCTIKGNVTSTTKFVGVDDTGRRESIKNVYLLTPDRKLVTTETLSTTTKRISDHRTGKKYDSREFDFARIPANKSYIVQLSYAWTTAPERVNIHCPDAKGRYEFTIKPIKHTGNRLGG